MTSPDRNYDEFLRRAFHAMADPIEPVGDGLARIRQQIDGPWLRRQALLLFAECVDLITLIVVRAEALGLWVRDHAVRGAVAARPGLTAAGRPVRAGVPGRQARQATAGSHRTASHRAGPEPARRRAGLGSLAWVRPALAAASVLALVAIGAVGLTPSLRTSFATAISNLVTGGGNGGSTAGGPPGSGTSRGGRGGISGGGSLSPSGQSSRGSHGTSPGQSSFNANSSPPQPSQCTSSPPVQPSPSPSATQSPSPTPTPTPTQTVSPSPTATPTGSPGPSVQASAMSNLEPGAGGPLGSNPCGQPTPPPPSPSPSSTPSIPSGSGGSALPPAAAGPVAYGLPAWRMR